MTILQASNMKFTCIKAGADNTTADDPYLKIGNSIYAALPVFHPSGATGFSGITNAVGTGDSGSFLGKAPHFSDAVGNGKLAFQLFDEDSFGADGFASIFEGGDDFIGSTSYTATGNEPLVGHGSLHFVNFMNGGGSSYKFEYDIARFSTSGKVSSAKGGVMDGRNTDGTMVGLGGKDIINGNNGDDLILGGGNSDTLNGGKGDDVIFGGKGIDRLSGNAGKDTFILTHNSGLDTIQDFRVGQDHIGLAGNLTFQDLSFVKGSGGTIVKAGNQQLALLDGINPNQLSASSFVQSDLASINSLVSANLATIKAS